MKIEASLISDVNLNAERIMLRYLTNIMYKFCLQVYESNPETAQTNFREFVDWPDRIKKNKASKFIEILKKKHPQFDLINSLKSRIVAAVCVNAAGRSRTCPQQIILNENDVNIFIQDLLAEITSLIGESSNLDLMANQQRFKFKMFAREAFENALVDAITKKYFNSKSVDEPDDSDSEHTGNTGNMEHSSPVLHQGLQMNRNFDSNTSNFDAKDNEEEEEEEDDIFKTDDEEEEEEEKNNEEKNATPPGVDNEIPKIPKKDSESNPSDIFNTKIS